MKTKIWALALAATALVTNSYAQDGTTFGLRAGVNFQNVNGKDFEGDKIEDNKLKTGFHIGVNAEIPVAPEFYIQPGVLFSTKGAKDDDLKAKLNLSYIEVPINFLYKPELGAGKLLLGIGPYVAFAVGGKVDPDNGDDVDVEFEKEITAAQYLSGKPYFKRFDAGGNLLFGYEFSNKFSLQANAQLGLVNINPEIEGVSNDKSKLKNTGFGVSLGYRF
jgi:hypothetical protein